VAAIGGFLFGFDTAVINGAVAAVQKQFHVGPVSLGLAVSSALLGSALGAIIAGRLADRFGRVPTMIMAATTFLIQSFGVAFSFTVYDFSFWRFIGGVAVGAASVIAPAYIAEVAPASLRGRLGSLQQLAIVVGIFIVNLVLAVLPASLHTGRPYLVLLRQAAEASWTASLSLAACAVSVALLAVEAPVAAALPLVVLPLIFRMNLAIQAQGKTNEQLAGVLAAQRRFLTDVSHQVATPLATIMTNLSLLQRAKRGDSSGQAIEDSVAEAERMKRMLARLRALAHADEDVPLRRELVDLAELTADVSRAYAAQAATSGVGLVTEVMTPARISADKDLLREAVANLVDNAVRFSPRGTDVKLRVARGAGGPSIDVIDSGPGIEEQQLPRLFERFQRSDSGSGLGLAIARRVVERHGGTIRVQTARGAGSTFTIELPDDPS